MIVEQSQGMGELALSLKPPKALRNAVRKIGLRSVTQAAGRVVGRVLPVVGRALPIVGAAAAAAAAVAAATRGGARDGRNPIGERIVARVVDTVGRGAAAPPADETTAQPRVKRRAAGIASRWRAIYAQTRGSLVRGGAGSAVRPPKGPAERLPSRPLASSRTIARVAERLPAVAAAAAHSSPVPPATAEASTVTAAAPGASTAAAPIAASQAYAPDAGISPLGPLTAKPEAEALPPREARAQSNTLMLIGAAGLGLWMLSARKGGPR